MLKDEAKPSIKPSVVQSTPGRAIAFSTAENRVSIHHAVRRGQLRKVAHGIYTSNLTAPVEQVVQTYKWDIAAKYFPNALIADRTAIEHKPAEDGSIFLVAARTQPLTLPGLTIWPRRGTPPLPDWDRPFIGGLFMSCQPRALLENLRSSRERRHVSRTLRQEGVERFLEEMLRKAGEPTVNRLRDEAKKIAPALQCEKEAETLTKLIGALMGTRTARLSSAAGIARSRGEGYDPERLKLFENFRADLAATHFTGIPATRPNSYLPFFEAYFSNFIEGTEFVLDEAFDVVFNHKIPEGRPEDAHDILGTFHIIADETERKRTAANPNEFVDLLTTRHAMLMGGRPDKRPGEFKRSRNKAGATEFVAPELVRGTLKSGFELLMSLEYPMARANFAMFLIAEVHPFDDGNGRVARIFMNAELSAHEEQRIIIPTVFRTEYLQSLRALSTNGTSKPLMRVLEFGQRYTAAIDFNDYDAARFELEQTNAFEDPADALGAGAKLLMPSATRLHRNSNE